MPEQIICPVCGSSVPANSSQCEFCHTLFGLDSQSPEMESTNNAPVEKPAQRDEGLVPMNTGSAQTNGRPANSNGKPVQQGEKDLQKNDAQDLKNGASANVPSKPAQIKLIGRNTQPLKPIQASPEALVPRLGDYLVEEGVVTPEDIQRALALQEKRAAVGRSLLLGEALMEMGLLERQDLDRIVTRQLLTFHSALQEANRTLEQRVQERTLDLEYRLIQIRTAAEITQAAVSATSLDDLLRRTVDLLQQRFDFLVVSIFMLADSKKTFVLKAVAGEHAEEINQKGFRIEFGSATLLGWVAAHNQPRIASMSEGDFFAVQEKISPDSRSEAGVPISINNQVLGLLDVQHAKSYALDDDVIAVLQTIANHMASVISNIHLLEVTRQGLKEISSLYKASQQIMQASLPEDVLTVVTQALSASEYPSIMFIPIAQQFRVLSSNGMKKLMDAEKSPKLPTLNELRVFLQPGIMPLVIESGKSDGLSTVLAGFSAQMGWSGAVCFPIWCHTRLDGLFFLGTSYPGQIPQAIIQSFASLASMASTALDKLYATQTMQKRLEALQTMNTISQAVSVATDINTLYQVIHNEVVRIIGEVDFLIAEFNPQTNMIQIPYMVDSGSLVAYEPFPIGEGLVSIVINAGQPLRLVENTEARAREMGAKILGKPAKSWLGVPLIVANETVGVMVVQDLENEFRFDEDDQLLLNTLASQVAVALRNARLLDEMYQQAERERRLFEITNRIRSATDIQTILQTTSNELRKVLGANRARIELGTLGKTLPGEVMADLEETQEN